MKWPDRSYELVEATLVVEAGRERAIPNRVDKLGWTPERAVSTPSMGRFGKGRAA